MNISIVIPLLNEDESLPELEKWIRQVMDSNRFSYEVIFIDDGSTDDSWNVIQKLSKKNPNIKAIKFRRNYGKSAALSEGFAAVNGDVVITMDADLQDSPDEIPSLYKMITEENYDIVSGWKKKRYDPIGKTLPSKFFNRLTRVMSGIKLNDFNCGLKAYKKEVVQSIHIYGDMHRYIPVVAKREGFSKIGEKVVEHRARQYGESKFGFARIVGVLDIISIMFLSKFGKRPMHLFGTLGVLAFLVGFGISFYLAFIKLVFGIGEIHDRPLFYLGLLMIILGSQFFLAGFLAEMLARTENKVQHYQIEQKTNISE